MGAAIDDGRASYRRNVNTRHSRENGRSVSRCDAESDRRWQRKRRDRCLEETRHSKPEGRFGLVATALASAILHDEAGAVVFDRPGSRRAGVRLKRSITAAELSSRSGPWGRMATG